MSCVLFTKFTSKLVCGECRVETLKLTQSSYDRTVNSNGVQFGEDKVDLTKRKRIACFNEAIVVEPRDCATPSLVE